MQTRIDDISAPEGRPATAKAARNADRVLHLVGQKWLLHVLRDICKGLTRFNQIQASLELSRALLTDRLRRLVAEGMIEMTALPGRKSRRRHYVPTAKGRALYQIILQMQNWQLTH